jgi:8-oxo-dGTP pyrophosphatase MutT (NUDIX family)
VTKYPPLPVFNEADEQVGEAMLEEILTKGLWHRVTRVVVMNTDGEILLQLRAPHLHTDPDKWDYGTAGYVDLGETYEQTARRELAEELGLQGFEPEYLGTHPEKTVINGAEVRRFVGMFRVVIPPETKLVPQESEVSEIKWLTPEQISALIAEHPDKVTSYFKDWFQQEYGDENNEH